MTTKRTVPEGRWWTVTSSGRMHAEAAPTCLCDIKLIGILFACPDCGTVMGSVKDAMKPQARRWNYGKRA